MYSIVKLTKEGLIEVCKVRTVEEAYYMLGEWMKYEPENNFEMMKVE